MARALEPNQPRCPGLSPPGSPPPPWLHPHRSCIWPPSHPNLASGSRPQPLTLCWAHRNTAGAYGAAGARRVLPGKPCLSGSGPGSQPTSFLPPPGGVPHLQAPPTSGVTDGAPRPHTQGLFCFFMPGPWEQGVTGAPNLALWQAFASLLLAWEAQTAPPFHSWTKLRCREVKKLAYSLLSGK